MKKKPDNVVDFGLANLARDHGVPVPAEGGRRKIKAVWADEITLEIDKPGLVDGLLGTTGMTVVYGESGAGKSFVVIDLACHVAAGLPWRGMEVEQGIVLYIAAESPKSIERRIWAWKQRHGVTHLPVLVVQSSVDLLNGDAEELAALIRDVGEKHGRVALVVVDTLARAMTGNENAPEDMGKFVAACDQLRQACDGHVLIVHHSGKDQARGARGHSCLRAATDVEMEVTKAEDGRCLAVKKNRDGEEGATYGFRLDNVELGTNAKGRVVTTCVTVDTEAPAKRETKSRPRRLSDTAKVIVQAVETGLKYKPERPPDHDETRAVSQVVSEDTARLYWRQLVGWEEATEKEKERSRWRWKRGLENALAAGAVKRWGTWIWLS